MKQLKLVTKIPRFLMTMLSLAMSCAFLAACTPTVQLETPKEGITINMNVVVDHNINVEMDEQTKEALQK